MPVEKQDLAIVAPALQVSPGTHETKEDRAPRRSAPVYACSLIGNRASHFHIAESPVTKTNHRGPFRHQSSWTIDLPCLPGFPPAFTLKPLVQLHSNLRTNIPITLKFRHFSKISDTCKHKNV